MRKIILIAALLLTPVSGFAQEQRLPTNIFEIMGIKGETWETASHGIARGEKWRRHDWANRYLFIDTAHSWPYEATDEDKAASDWQLYEE